VPAVAFAFYSWVFMPTHQEKIKPLVIVPGQRSGDKKAELQSFFDRVKSKDSEQEKVFDGKIISCPSTLSPSRLKSP
jgi:hypothetical protein